MECSVRIQDVPSSEAAIRLIEGPLFNVALADMKLPAIALLLRGCVIPQLERSTHRNNPAHGTLLACAFRLSLHLATVRNSHVASPKALAVTRQHVRPFCISYLDTVVRGNSTHAQNGGRCDLVTVKSVLDELAPFLAAVGYTGATSQHTFSFPFEMHLALLRALSAQLSRSVTARVVEDIGDRDLISSTPLHAGIALSSSDRRLLLPMAINLADMCYGQITTAVGEQLIRLRGQGDAEDTAADEKRVSDVSISARRACDDILPGIARALGGPAASAVSSSGGPSPALSRKLLEIMRQELSALPRKRGKQKGHGAGHLDVLKKPRLAAPLPPLASAPVPHADVM